MRMYNQAVLLANAIGKYMNKPLVFDALTKKKMDKTTNITCQKKQTY